MSSWEIPPEDEDGGYARAEDEAYWERVDRELEDTRRLTEARRRNAEAMRYNNPRGEPVGAFTGRCPQCGSQNLWDDNCAYGCKDCGYFSTQFQG